MTLPINITKYDGDFAEPVTPNDIEEIAKEVFESRQNVVFFIRPDGKWAYARYARGSDYPEGSEMKECCPFPLSGGYTRVDAVDPLNRAITSHVPVPKSSTFIYGQITRQQPDNAVASYLADNPIVGTCAITYGKWSSDKGDPDQKARGKEDLLQGECTHCGRSADEHHATYGECPAEAYVDVNGGDMDDYALNDDEFICSNEGRDDEYRYVSDQGGEPDLDAVCEHCGKTAWQHNTVACPDGSGNHFKDSGRYRRPCS